MASETQGPNEIRWVFFSDDIAGAKLKWLQQQFEMEGIQHRSPSKGMRGKPIIEVPFHDFMMAHTILHREVGSSGGGFNLTYHNLPDEHDIFDEFVPAYSRVPAEIEQVVLPKFPLPIEFFNVESSNISAVAWVKTSVFVRYKGGTYYVYHPIGKETLQIIQNEVSNKSKGDPTASVGSVVNRLLKVPADQGQIECFKLTDDNTWAKVMARGKTK